MKKTATLIFFILISLTQLNSQKLYFRRIDINDGLSQNTVTDIMQDRNGFMWFCTKDGLNRYDGLHFRIFQNIPGKEERLGNIRCIDEDQDGRIWIGTSSGLYVYDPVSEIFSKKPFGGGSPDYPIQDLKCGGNGNIWIIAERAGIYRHYSKEGKTELAYGTDKPLRTLAIDDNSGTIWVSQSGKGLFYTDDEFRNIKTFQPRGNRELFQNDIISHILISDYNKIFLGLERGGLVELNKATGEIKKIGLSDTQLFVRCAVQYSAKELWIGTETGLYIYNTETGRVQHFENSPHDLYSLSDNSIHSICKDSEGGIWIGTFFGGINYVPKRDPDFTKYYYSECNGGLMAKRIRDICQAEGNALWIGTEDAGLYHFDTAGEKFMHFGASKEFSNIQCLLMDGRELWVGTFSKGIRVIDIRNGSIRKYESSSIPGPRLFSNDIFALAKTSRGKIYIGTMHGLQFYNRETDDFGFVPEINGGKMVNEIFEDSDGNLWVGTYSDGAYRQNANSGKWEHFSTEKGNKSSIPTNNIISFFEDSKKRIWITTEGGGFCRYDLAANSFCTFSSNDGMPSDVVYRIEEDKSGFFWISTNNGLVLFDPGKWEILKIYSTNDGLLCNQFNYCSSYTDNTGRIYFGSIEGLTSFDPITVLNKFQKTAEPPVVITDFSLLGSSEGTKDIPLKESILYTDTVTLRYNQNTFTIQLAALGFSEAHQIIYRMEGLDERWQTYDNSHVTYSNISPGRYIFHAKLADSKDGTPGKLLMINVRPPFWKSTAANIAYMVLLLCAVLFLTDYYRRQMQTRHAEYIKSYKQEKEKEIYDSKIRLFTSITHEIRTPLTLIKGPLDNIRNKKDISPDIAEDLDIMGRNTDRLLVLVNELLDFQKLEKDKMTITPEKVNISDIAEDVSRRFSSTMSYMQKTFHMDMSDREIYANADREAVTKIISNLFSNAMKYSERNISVNISRSGSEVVLVITNDGIPVPENKREAIFAPFFRSTNEQSGTGIGLYLARSLAELQHGSLTMGPESDKNTFILKLPVYSTEKEHDLALKDIPCEEMSDNSMCEDITDDSSSYILVVEDDLEVCNFVKRQLKAHWPVLTAQNGKEALKILDKYHIILIVSDIMMPEMDGIELCRIVKSDINYTHIPLVMLTARTNLESKIEGMDAGADAYVEKPFSTSYLISIITNLLKRRQQTIDTFRKNPLTIIDDKDISNEDSVFMKRLQEIIHENMANSKFRMDEIAEMMHMSRATYYRKIKGIIDMTPNDYLRLERLKAAARLLAGSDYNISEVCYMVGFKSPSYFSKCFYRQFGEYPKTFIQNLNKETKTEII